MWALLEMRVSLEGRALYEERWYVVLIGLHCFNNISSNNFLPRNTFLNTFLIWIVSMETVQFIRVKNWHFRQIYFSNTNSCFEHYLWSTVFGCTTFWPTQFFSETVYLKAFLWLIWNFKETFGFIVNQWNVANCW